MSLSRDARLHTQIAQLGRDLKRMQWRIRARLAERRPWAARQMSSKNKETQSDDTEFRLLTARDLGAPWPQSIGEQTPDTQPGYPAIQPDDWSSQSEASGARAKMEMVLRVKPSSLRHWARAPLRPRSRRRSVPPAGSGQESTLAGAKNRSGQQRKEVHMWRRRKPIAQEWPDGPATGARDRLPATTQQTARYHPATAHRVVRCPQCQQLLIRKDWLENLQTCGYCDHHFRLYAPERIAHLLDEASFCALAGGAPSDGPQRTRTPGPPCLGEQAPAPVPVHIPVPVDSAAAVQIGMGAIGGIPVAVAVLEYALMRATLGLVVGEQVTRCIHHAAERHCAFVAVLSMPAEESVPEGVPALFQAAKITAALARLAEIPAPFIAVFTSSLAHASTLCFAYLADVILAEPTAQSSRAAFHGSRKRPLWSTHDSTMTTATSAQAYGMVDAVVHRRDLRPTLVRLLRLYAACGATDETWESLRPQHR